MAERNDILMDDTDDLLTEGGDLVCGVSDYQHVKHIIQAAPGHFKQWPLLGGNVMQFINGSSAELISNLKKQLIADGYSTKKLSIVNGIMEVDI